MRIFSEYDIALLAHILFWYLWKWIKVDTDFESKFFDGSENFVFAPHEKM